MESIPPIGSSESTDLERIKNKKLDKVMEMDERSLQAKKELKDLEMALDKMKKEVEKKRKEAEELHRAYRALYIDYNDWCAENFVDKEALAAFEKKINP